MYVVGGFQPCVPDRNADAGKEAPPTQRVAASSELALELLFPIKTMRA